MVYVTSSKPPSCPAQAYLVDIRLLFGEMNILQDFIFYTSKEGVITEFFDHGVLERSGLRVI